MDQSTPVQQTPKPKNNTTALILLSVIAVLGVGFGIYGMVSGAKSSTPAAKTPDSSKQQNQSQDQEQQSEKPANQDISDNPEASKEERYQAFLNNLAQSSKGKSIVTTDRNGHYSTTLSDNNLKVTNNGNAICTDAGGDIVTAFIGQRGQTEPVVYYLKKNGDLYACEQTDKTVYTSKKIENAQYIIDFAYGFSDETWYTYLIDIDGNIITMPNDLNL